MAFQGLFRRNSEFVVVKPVHLNANETLEVGTVIDMAKGNVKWFQLRLWFRRRRIGTKDSEWVNQILEGARRPEGATISTKRDINRLAETLSAVKDAKASDSTAEPSNGQETASTEPEVGIETLEADAEREQKEADEAKEKLARARKDAKNQRERERRAAKKADK